MAQACQPHPRGFQPQRARHSTRDGEKNAVVRSSYTMYRPRRHSALASSNITAQTSRANRRFSNRSLSSPGSAKALLQQRSPALSRKPRTKLSDQERPGCSLNRPASHVLKTGRKAPCATLAKAPEAYRFSAWPPPATTPHEPSTCRQQGCSLIQPASHMLGTSRKAPFPAAGSAHERVVASTQHKTTPCTTLEFSEPRPPPRPAPCRPVSRHQQHQATSSTCPANRSPGQKTQASTTATSAAALTLALQSQAGSSHN